MQFLRTNSKIIRRNNYILTNSKIHSKNNLETYSHANFWNRDEWQTETHSSAWPSLVRLLRPFWRQTCAFWQTGVSKSSGNGRRLYTYYGHANQRLFTLISFEKARSNMKTMRCDQHATSDQNVAVHVYKAYFYNSRIIWREFQTQILHMNIFMHNFQAVILIVSHGLITAPLRNAVRKNKGKSSIEFSRRGNDGGGWIWGVWVGNPRGLV